MRIHWPAGVVAALPDQFDQLGDAVRLVGLHVAQVLGSQDEVVVIVVEGRDDGDPGLIDHVGASRDQPIQTVWVFRDRDDPLVAQGDGTVDLAALGHRVDRLSTYDPVDQAGCHAGFTWRSALVHTKPP